MKHDETQNFIELIMNSNVLVNMKGDKMVIPQCQFKWYITKQTFQTEPQNFMLFFPIKRV